MTKKQYRDALATLGISQEKAARLLCANVRTSRRWALGERPIPPLVAKVLRYMIARKIKPEDFHP